MKKYYSIACAFFILGMKITNAQYVTIPDANFVTYLNTVVPSAMSGNQMDTTNASVLSLASIDVENLGILNLSGIQYFKALITLDCGNGSPSIDSNHITSLPNLPGTLDTLICGNNQITILPALPGGLVYLACYINNLTQLPALPGTLIYLDCSTDSITSLPALPASLKNLVCDNNQLTILPALPQLDTLTCGGNLIISLPTLPNTLLELECIANKLTALPALPNSLLYLDCSFNNSITILPALPPLLTLLSFQFDQITSLPVLPSSLINLDCNDNLLTSLPPLPATLGVLSCYDNNLTSLPALPSTILELYCFNNQLTSLPALPISLNELWCQNNNIYCFPVFPNGMMDSTFFNISGNPFTCLPNYVSGMTSEYLAYPLCAPGNPNGCVSASGIIGYTYEDMNSDCIRDSGDINLKNVPVQLYSGSNALVSQTYSAINGIYGFPDTGATYKAIVDTAGMPFVVQCSHPGLDSMFTMTNIDTNINFSLTCRSGFDVGVQSVVTTGLIFPGIQHDLSVVAGDMSHWFNLNCANGDSGTVQIDVSGPVTYVGPGVGALTPTVISGTDFKYSIPNYGTINNSTAFNLLLKTDTNAQARDSICVNVTVTPLIDNNTGNNNYRYCYDVINSHDPNNKSVYPVDVAPYYDGWFTYTIHFQNTGTATAKNILISDTLASNLNVKTFQLINYSAANTTFLTGNVLTFQFTNINLPDSAANPTGSTGFVQYRIKPNSGLPNGTIIQNTGYIYFDYNSAIITDTTSNLFTAVITGSNTLKLNSSCELYPNPNKGIFTIGLQNPESKYRVLIYNELGEQVFQTILTSVNTEVNLGVKSTGIYFYRIIDQNGQLISDGKMVVEQ